MSEEDLHTHETTRYEPSGIDEKHGIVPTWLAVVYTAMGIWMIWYMITFWTDKG